MGHRKTNTGTFRKDQLGHTVARRPAAVVVVGRQQVPRQQAVAGEQQGQHRRVQRWALG